MPPSNFPRDLIAAIIHELIDDLPTLFSCSLVSSVFRHHSQKYIFREIAINFDTHGQNSSNAARLSEIILKNPALPSAVRSLILILGDVPSSHTTFQMPGVFPNTQKLTLTSRSDFIDWTNMPGDTRGTIITLLRQPSIKTLVLNRHSHFPVDLLLCFPNISSLYVEAISTERSLPQTNPYTVSSTSTLSLRSFSAVVYGNDVVSIDSVQSILDIFAPSLIDVTLDYIGNETSLTAFELNLNDIVNLRSLKLILRINKVPMRLHPVSRSLETLSSASRHVDVDLSIRFLERIEDPYDVEWSELDRTLSNLLDSTVLGSLRVVLSSYKPDEKGLERIRGLMNGLDARLCVRTISGSQEFL